MTQCGCCESYTLNWSQDFLSPVGAMKTSAALRPERRSPIVVNPSILKLHCCHHSFSASWLAAPQPASARTHIDRLIYTPTLFSILDTGVGATTARWICAVTFEVLCTAVELASQM